MSDTPRTGGFLEKIIRRDRFLSDKNAPEEWVVYARQLERELSAANAQIGLLISGAKKDERTIKYLQERIQRLVEAGDNMAMWLLDSRNLGADEIAADHWMKAKEEKPS